MAGKARIGFDELSRPIVADRERAARVNEAYEEAKNEHLAFSLNKIREALGISQEELATHLGITQSAVSQALKNPATIALMRRLVIGMGAELEVNVKVGDQRFPVDA